MPRFPLKPALLLMSIFIMAGIYESMWRARPDFFRVQSGVNFLPLDLVKIARDYSAYSAQKPLPDLLRNQGLEPTTNRIEELYQKMQLASALLAKQKDDLATGLPEDVEEYKAFETSQWAQFEEYVAQKTAPFVTQIAGIQRSMQSILTADGVKTENDLPSGEQAILYATLNIKRAQIEIQRAKAEVDARDYGLHHLRDFQQQPSQKEYSARHAEVEELQAFIFAAQNSTDSLHGELYNAFVDYLAAANARLGYWDFVYFSVGAATTATFGDISPNSTTVRLLVCLQVLGSIIITGLIINDLAGRR